MDTGRGSKAEFHHKGTKVRTQLRGAPEPAAAQRPDGVGRQGWHAEGFFSRIKPGTGWTFSYMTGGMTAQTYTLPAEARTLRSEGAIDQREPGLELESKQLVCERSAGRQQDLHQALVVVVQSSLVFDRGQRCPHAERRLLRV